ncbi:uncharacterized protein LOC142338574 [Convolutriloba macropyga]|uniref:uncharacterized protein LOC142338574 n=1 Tax=Convolutriloba macropyga TaxID=536237 RepID=UPI003F523ADE
MCLSNTPCCLQVFLLVLWTTLFFSSILVLFIHSSFDEKMAEYKLEYILGERDEVILPFPRLFCEKLYVRRTNDPEVGLSGDGCILKARKPSSGPNEKIVLEGPSIQLNPNGNTVIAQTMKPESSYPGFFNQYNSSYGVQYSIFVSLSEYSQTSATVAFFDSYKDVEKVLKSQNETQSCAHWTDSFLLKPGRSLSSDAPDDDPDVNIAVVCPTIQDAVLDGTISLSVTKYNTILSQNMICPFDYSSSSSSDGDDVNNNNPIDFTWDCVNKQDVDRNGNYNCTVVMDFTLATLGYFSDPMMWTLWTPIALVSSPPNRFAQYNPTAASRWEVSCDVRIELLVAILIIQLLLTLCVLFTSVTCFRQKKELY